MYALPVQREAPKSPVVPDLHNPDIKTGRSSYFRESRVESSLDVYKRQIHYDPWWNVAVQNQATDRAHRIGQKNVVTVYKLVSQGTIEEKIIDIQEKKKKLAEQVLEGEGMDSVVFTKEEIMELLG